MSQRTNARAWHTTAITAAVICCLYIILYKVNVLIMGSDDFGGIASLVFLPAFIRLLGFLLIGYWTIPALFVAAWFCVDLGLDPISQFIVALSLSIGSSIATGEVSRAIDLNLTLANLTGAKLLILSLASATGNAAAYYFGLSLVGAEANSSSTFYATILGDTLGTWIMIYGLKGVLIILDRHIFLRP